MRRCNSAGAEGEEGVSTRILGLCPVCRVSGANSNLPAKIEWRLFQHRTMNLHLRSVATDDLPLFFTYQRDPVASRMAAFGTANPDDREAFDAHWAYVLTEPLNVTRTVVCDGEVAGHVSSFLLLGEREVSYWIDRARWGRGIATAALRRFMAEQAERPLHARAAKDNAASIRILLKCGFAVCGEGRALAEARGHEVDEFVFRLDGAPGPMPQ